MNGTSNETLSREPKILKCIEHITHQLIQLLSIKKSPSLVTLHALFGEDNFSKINIFQLKFIFLYFLNPKKELSLYGISPLFDQTILVKCHICQIVVKLPQFTDHLSKRESYVLFVFISEILGILI